MNLILENWRLFTESHTKEHEEELKTIVGELEKASEMHAGQAKRIQQILDETDDDKLEEGEGKNCGCGQDPCKTYGIQVKVEEDEAPIEEDCQDGYERVPGSVEFEQGSCRKKTNEAEEIELDEKKKQQKGKKRAAKTKKRDKKKKSSAKKDACYNKVKSRYKVWPSAYASGALVKCRKVGAANWGNSKKESVEIMIEDEVAFILHEKKQASKEKNLGDWFGRQGEKGSKGGWVDCNAPDGDGGYKECAQGDRKKKPYCRPTPSACKEEPKNEAIYKVIDEEIEAVLDEKKKKACKPSKGKRFAKRVNGKCRSYGQKGQAKGGGDRIRPGTKKGDAYCARSAKIKKCKNPPCANALSRKKWKCRGSKSMKE